MDLLNTISNNRLWNKHGVQAVWGIALFCALISVTTIIWSVITQNKTKQLNYQPQVITPISTKSDRPYQINDIVAANLFGNPNPTIIVKKAPKTTLDLTLKGILWATDPNLARAIIMSGKKKSVLYSVGENIKGAGASVIEIHDTEVLLNRNGTTESLPLIRLTSSGNREVIIFTDPKPDPVVQKALVSSAKKLLSKEAISAKIKHSNFKQRAKNSGPRNARKQNYSDLRTAFKEKEGFKRYDNSKRFDNSRKKDEF